MEIQLKDLIQVRCGDKGNDSDINVFAPNEQIYELLKTELTTSRIKDYFGDLVKGEVIRYEVPNVLALKFHLKDALAGGGPASLRRDNLGKTLGSALLRMKVDIDDHLAQTKSIQVPSLL